MVPLFFLEGEKEVSRKFKVTMPTQLPKTKGEKATSLMAFPPFLLQSSPLLGRPFSVITFATCSFTSFRCLSKYHLSVR